MLHQGLRTGLVGLALVLGFGFASCGDSEGDSNLTPDDKNPPVEEIRPIEERALEQWNFLDEAGRVLILRGVNLAGAAKGPTGLPGTVENTESDAEQIKDLGFNVVRYLIQWKNIEPAPNEYDYEYLADVRERLDLLHAQGIKVVLDMHQDVYGPKFGFNGGADWTVRDDGIPYVQNPNWFLNYMTPAVQRAFDNFFNYEEHGDLQDHFADMWRETAKELGDHPAVIAFDIMNEPHPGTDWDLLEFGSDNSKSSHARFDREKLGPFYQRVINAIREANADKWILYESRYGVPGDGGKCYVEKLTDPREGNSRLFQAPHLYILNTEASRVYGANAEKRVAKWETERVSERDKNVTGMWLGEFGTFTSVENYQKYMEDILAVTERMRIGFAAWSWDVFEFGMIGERDPETGRHEEGPFLDIISRPYPRAFAGTPLSFMFTPETEVLEATWKVDHSIEAPTEFFMAQQRWYENGYDVSVTPEAGVTIESSEDGQIVWITVDEASIEEVSVTFSPSELVLP